MVAQLPEVILWPPYSNMCKCFSYHVCRTERWHASFKVRGPPPPHSIDEVQTTPPHVPLLYHSGRATSLRMRFRSASRQRQVADILLCSTSQVPGTRLHSWRLPLIKMRDLNHPGICTLPLSIGWGFFLSLKCCHCRKREMIFMIGAAALLLNSFMITGVGGKKPSRIINSLKFPFFSLQLSLKKCS